MRGRLSSFSLTSLLWLLHRLRRAFINRLTFPPIVCGIMVEQPAPSSESHFCSNKNLVSTSRWLRTAKLMSRFLEDKSASATRNITLTSAYGPAASPKTMLGGLHTLGKMNDWSSQPFFKAVRSYILLILAFCQSGWDQHLDKFWRHDWSITSISFSAFFKHQFSPIHNCPYQWRRFMLFLMLI